MSGLELPAFVVGVAGLFSSSVDAFSYFKAAQNADEDVDTVLLKLDVEKTRLLLWANEIGMFSVNKQHPRLLDEAVVNLISRILKKVITKLTDSEQLRASYGVVNLDWPRAKAIDYVSSNGFEIFQRSSRRFWTRYASKLRLQRAPGEGSPLMKTKWAIYEKERFQALVNDVKDFVDNLYEFIPVDKETQMHVFKADIESIPDISHLTLVETATEDSYRIYSRIAGSAREASEKGTADRRNLEEYIRDAESLNLETNSSHVQNSDLIRDINSLTGEVLPHDFQVVLTSPCHKLGTPTPCNVFQLGEQSGQWNAEKTVGYQSNWGVTPNGNHDHALWNLLKDLTRIKETILEAFDDHRSEVMAQIAKGKFESGSAEKDVAEAFLPFLTIFIYCSLCACHIHTALDICYRLKSKFVSLKIRPDDRIRSSCCLTADRIAGLKSIRDYVDQTDTDGWGRSGLISKHLDRQWLDLRLESFEYEQSFNYEEIREREVVVIGEIDCLQHLLAKSSGRIPKAGEIWSVRRKYDYTSEKSFMKRDFEYRFAEKRREIMVDKVPSVKQQLQPHPYTSSTEASGSKRALFSIPTDNKRQRLSDTSEAEDSAEEITTTSVSSSHMRTE